MKNAIHRAEDLALFSDNHWETRPKLNTERVAIMNEIIIENHRLAKQPLNISKKTPLRGMTTSF